MGYTRRDGIEGKRGALCAPVCIDTTWKCIRIPFDWFARRLPSAVQKGRGASVTKYRKDMPLTMSEEHLRVIDNAASFGLKTRFSSVLYNISIELISTHFVTECFFFFKYIPLVDTTTSQFLHGPWVGRRVGRNQPRAPTVSLTRGGSRWSLRENRTGRKGRDRRRMTSTSREDRDRKLEWLDGAVKKRLREDFRTEREVALSNCPYKIVSAGTRR